MSIHSCIQIHGGLRTCAICNLPYGKVAPANTCPGHKLARMLVNIVLTFELTSIGTSNQWINIFKTRTVLAICGGHQESGIGEQHELFSC